MTFPLPSSMVTATSVARSTVNSNFNLSSARTTVGFFVKVGMASAAESGARSSRLKTMAEVAFMFCSWALAVNPSNDLLDHLPMHQREPLLAPQVRVAQLVLVEPELVQDGGVN